MKLSEIAYLQSGLVLNRKEANTSKETVKTYHRLNLRSLNEDGTIDHAQLDVFYSKAVIDSNMLTHENDIVLKLFVPMNPTLILSEDEGLVIPSQLAVVRVRDNRILPSFLCYWLSTPRAMEFILLHEGWQSQRAIKISVMEDVDVPILPLEKQKMISETVSLQKKRNNLYRMLMEEENKRTSLIIQQAIGGKRK